MIFHELGLVAGMPAETSQRPSGVAFSSPRILIVCSTVHMRSIVMKMRQMLFLALSRWRVSAEDIGNGLNKMKIRWCMLDKSLTYAWQSWQSWHLHCVFGRHADGWSRTAKTVRRFFLTMMLLSPVSEEVYFPCVLFVELPLIECTKPCFEWRYQQDHQL